MLRPPVAPELPPYVLQHNGKKMKVSPRIGKRDGRPQHTPSPEGVIPLTEAAHALKCRFFARRKCTVMKV